MLARSVLFWENIPPWRRGLNEMSDPQQEVQELIQPTEGLGGAPQAVSQQLGEPSAATGGGPQEVLPISVPRDSTSNKPI